MKILQCFAAITLAALAACTSTSNAVGHIDASWKIEQVGSDGSATSATCPSGDGSASLYMQPLDENNNPVGKPTVSTFDCTAGSGTSPAFELGSYNAWIQLEDKAGGTATVQSPTSLDLNGAPLVMGTSDLSLSEYILLDGGYFRYEWNLIGATSGSAVSCSSTSAASFLMTATNVTTSTEVFTATTPCNIDPNAVHFALSNAIPTGVYTVAIVINDSTGSASGPVTTLQNQMIQAASALQPVTDMGMVNVEINGM
jgi:hypothetical protein